MSLTALKIERMGDRVGVTLPREVVAKLDLTQGGVLFVAEVSGGEPA